MNAHHSGPEHPHPGDAAVVGHGHADHGGAESSLNRTAISATLHCLTGCAIGEVLGLVLSTWWGWSNGASIVLSVSLAFFFGYSLTMLPLLRAHLTLRQVLPLAFASDTLSIGTMEVIDSLIVIAVPGAMAAGLGRARRDAPASGEPPRPMTFPGAAPGNPDREAKNQALWGRTREHEADLWVALAISRD